ncbi:MAG TPA: hypothetical protein VGJ15_11690 [Pirellulales bacterium]|jgi:tetratricopeptide (TPR) repeat protein
MRPIKIYAWAAQLVCVPKIRWWPRQIGLLPTLICTIALLYLSAANRCAAQAFREAPAPGDVSPPSANSVANRNVADDGDSDSTQNTAENSAEQPQSPFATKFDDPPAHPPVTVEPARFKGIQPGDTTAKELARKWGEGKIVSQSNDESVLGFDVDSFSAVEVTLVDDKVSSIVLRLEQPQPPDLLVRQLQLDEFRAVNVNDDSGELLGQAFPERGVLFSTMPDGKRIAQVVLDQVDLSVFVVRAEADLESHARGSLADLNFVLSKQPRNARALWLRGKLLAKSARYEEALNSVDGALDIEPDQADYHLTRGEILGQQGIYKEASREFQQIITSDDASDLQKAKALCRLGDLLAASPAHDYKLAMEHHVSAVKLADPLSIDKNSTVRRAAKMLLVEAHLATANDIASGQWQQKDKAVAKWLDRANDYAEDLIAHEDADPALRLHVARGALAACAGAEGKIDPVPWARMALQYGKPLIVSTDDPTTKQQLEWELGLALADGLLADEFRGATQHAIPNTALTVSYVENGAQGRLEMPEDAYRLGWLYYRLGSLHAVGRKDHKTAFVWYEKALPLLDRPLPPTHRNEQGRYGEWLVSMGITYWEVGMRDFGLQLTDAGMQHIEEAVKNQLAKDSALAVPYSNLAFMHQSLGHTREARNYSQLAAKLDPTKSAKH